MITISPSLFSVPQSEAGPTGGDGSADQTKNFFSLLLALFPSVTPPQAPPPQVVVESAFSAELLVAQTTTPGAGAVSLTDASEGIETLPPVTIGNEEDVGSVPPAEQNLLLSLLLPFLGIQTQPALLDPTQAAQAPTQATPTSGRAVQAAALVSIPVSEKTALVAALPTGISDGATPANVEAEKATSKVVPPGPQEIAQTAQSPLVLQGSEGERLLSPEQKVKGQASGFNDVQTAAPMATLAAAQAETKLTARLATQEASPQSSLLERAGSTQNAQGATVPSPLAQLTFGEQKSGEKRGALQDGLFSIDDIPKGKGYAAAQSLRHSLASPEATATNRADSFLTSSLQTSPERPVESRGNLDSWQSVVDQMAHHIVETVSQESREAHLQLDPPELGKLDIQLVVEGARVRAHIVAESADVGALVQTHLPELKQALQGHRLDLDTVRVDVQSDGGGRNDSTQNFQRGTRSRRQGNTFGAAPVGENTGENAPVVSPIDSRGRVSVWA